MRKLVTGLFVVLSTGLFAQTRPNNFPEITSIDNTNFEVYSQKNGLPRRASLETLKRYFDQVLSFANDTLSLTGVDSSYSIYLPTGGGDIAINDLTDGYTEGTGNLILVSNPGGAGNLSYNSIIMGHNNLNFKKGYNTISIGNDIGETTSSLSGLGAYSVFIGNNTLENAGYAENVVHIGWRAGRDTKNGQYDVVIGTEAMRNGQTTDNTVAIGSAAARGMEFSSDNVIIGNLADYSRDTLENSVIIGSYSSSQANNDVNSIVIGYNAVGRGSNTAIIGNSSIQATYLNGTLNLNSYGSANKEASDLGKTGSGYFLEVATDGTLVETSISGAISNTFQQVVSSNSFDTIHVVAKPSAVSLATSNSRANYDLSVSSLADVRTVSIVMDLTVGTRQTQTIIKVDDASNESNVSLGTLMLPSITVYDAAPTLLDVNEVYNVTETLTNGDLPYKITFNNDGTYNIVFGQGDWGSKSRVVVTINF